MKDDISTQHECAAGGAPQPMQTCCRIQDTDWCTCDEGRPRLSTLEQVGVVAALAQLHHHVQQAAAVSSSVERINVLLQQSSVPARSHETHRYTHVLVSFLTKQAGCAHVDSRHNALCQCQLADTIHDQNSEFMIRIAHAAEMTATATSGQKHRHRHHPGVKKCIWPQASAVLQACASCLSCCLHVITVMFAAQQQGNHPATTG
jgi:hypothetical protein